jgi:heme a synthase
MASTAAAAVSSAIASNGTNLIKTGFPAVPNVSQNMYANTGKWILGTACSVVGMIHVGGITRLTQSGLSMTTWSPLGSLPPITHDEWMKEFERYQSFPEWSQRKSMTLSEFQYIYAWEYGHRMLGRTVGLIFITPWLYYTARGRIPKGYQGKMVGLLAMGGTQGLVGWWMVKSGLGDDRRSDKNEIRVKPVRLATHLTMAVATYGALLWTGLDILGLPYKESMVQSVTDAVKKVGAGGQDALRRAAKLRTGSLHLTALTGLTIVSGALVAGNDAGRAYNTFPKMDGQWIPSEIGDLKPWYKNMYENTATVQFQHRMLGMTTAAGAVGLATAGLAAAKSTTRMALLTPQARIGLMAVGVSAVGQVTLGVVTLLQYVPITLAAAHQIGSIVVFTSSVYLAHSLRYAQPALKRLATNASAKASGAAAAAAKNGSNAAAQTTTNVLASAARQG